MSFQFWQRWLMVVTGTVILYSLCLILVPDMMLNVFRALFFSTPNAVFSNEANAYIRLVQGVLGAVLVGWMATILSVLMSTFRRGERSAWNTITLSIVIWFVIDTGFSLVSGVVAHALFNIPFLILFAIPLGATFRQFRSKH